MGKPDRRLAVRAAPGVFGWCQGAMANPGRVGRSDQMPTR